MKRKLWFGLAVALQIVVLLVMIGSRWAILAYGEKILLKTAPVDPWDLFRGDYVVLRYEISELDLKTISSDSENYKRNETVYVALAQEGPYRVARSVSKNRPAGTLFIRGRVQWHNTWDRRLSLTYGIESYFVPQHQGLEIESQLTTLDAEVSVDRRGNASLSRLFIKGQEVKFR